MQCTSCGGKDEHCEQCGGWGHERITSCPREIITQDIWRLLQFSDFAEKGAYPVGGGVLEQCESFLAACRVVWSESAYWKAINGIK